MFKALMGGGRSDTRSTTSSSSKSRRRADSTKSSHSRKSSRGDDRDRALEEDESPYPPSASGSRRGPSSVAGDSVASTYMTAEPEPIGSPSPMIVERTPKRKDSDRESKSSRRRTRDRSESRERDKGKSRRSVVDGVYDVDDERNRRERQRTQPVEPYVPPISTSMPSSAPAAQFPIDMGAPEFSQFPGQFPHEPSSGSPHHGASPPHVVSPPAPFDPHVQQQFPGQFPVTSAGAYYPPNNPAGAAADYYGDQGQSVGASDGGLAVSQPPPEPSSLGELGAAADYFDDSFQVPEGPANLTSSKPPKPGKIDSKPTRPSKPSKISSSSAVPAVAAAGVAAYGLSSAMSSHHSESYNETTTVHHSNSYPQPAAPLNSVPSASKPPQSHGIGAGVGAAAAGAAAGYMLGHQHHASSPENASQYTFQNYEQPPSAGLAPHGSGPSNAVMPGGPEGYPMQNPGFYPHGTGALAMRHRPQGPLSKFADFWRDPEGVGRFEDYTEYIGVCKYCFEPGSSCLDAPRKHHYHGRRHSSDRYSSSGASRVSKLSRYQSSEDESRRRKKSHRSNKSTSWLPALGLFAGKEFKDSYSVRPSRGADDRVSSYDAETTSVSDRRSYTSRGVIRRPSSPREHYPESRHSHRTRSRSRSSSPSGHHSFVKEAALGAAIGGAALAVAKSNQRSRSRSPSRVERRKESSSSSSFLDVSRPSKSRSGFTSFFTSSSENRKKQKNRSKRKGFFSFNSSSSSSLDADLAFGTGFAKKLKSKKEKKGKKKEDVNAALLGLGATATALAASSPGRGRTTGQILSARDIRSRRSEYTSSANEESEWIDADSDDQSSESVASALAFGGSSADSGSDSSRSGWGFFGFNKKKKSKKEKKSSLGNAALAAGAGALGGAALASIARERDSRVSNSSGSLQQVYPTATSDPTRFDATRISPSVMSGEPPLVRPGAIPLQQPQPVTPVSQAVYTTQGSLPASIPAYSAPEASLVFASDPVFDQHFQGPRDPAYVAEDRQSDRRKHRRSDSTPIFPIQESSIPGPKRRSTAREAASVSFDLTEKQEEQQRLREKYAQSNTDNVYPAVQLIDREAEDAKRDEDRREFERQERRRREQEDEDRRRKEQEAEDRRRRQQEDEDRRRSQKEDEDRRRRQQDEEDRRRRQQEDEDRLRRKQEDEDRRRDSRPEKDSSSWAEAAAIGALSGAAASTIMSSRKTDYPEASEASSDRYSKRREKRRKEREESRMESSIVSRPDVATPIEEPVAPVLYEEEEKRTSPRRSPRSSPVYESYADFYAPDLHGSADQEKHSRDSGDPPKIVEVVPASEREREQPDVFKDTEDVPHPFAREPYEGYSLPFRVPALIYTKPTPEQSINGSACGVNSPIAPAETSVEPVYEHERQAEPKAKPEPEHQPEVESEVEPEHAPEPDVKYPQRFTTGSRVSWGHDKTHEYEVPSSSEHDPTDYDISPLDDQTKEFPLTTSEDEKKPVSKNDFGDDIEFAAIIAAGTEAAGFDPSVVLNDPKYHTRTSPPGSEDEGVFSPRSKWNDEKEKPHGFVEGEVESHELDQSKEIQPPQHVIEDKPFYSEPEYITNDQIPSSETRERGSIAQRVMEELDRKASPPSYAEHDVFSMPGGFDTPVEPREPVQSRDDSRSVVSAPVGREIEKSRKSRPSGDEFDLSRDIAPAVLEGAEAIDDEEKKKHRKRRSKRDSDTFSVGAESVVTVDDDDDKSERRRRRHRSSRDDIDDAASTFTVEDDDGKSERRRRRHHSSRDDDDAASTFTVDDDDKSERRRRRHRSSRDDNDDAASTFTVEDDDGKSERRRRSHRSKHGDDDDDARSVRSTRSTGEDDAKSERRTHSRHSSRDSLVDDRDKRRSKDDKEKSGGILRSLFGSRVSAPEERRSSSRSSSLDKRVSRDAVSEAGVDDEKRRRKKRSSSSRHSSSGEKLEGYDSDKVSVKDDANLEEYRSKRQEKEEQRRQRYGDIVDSGRRRESEKDGKRSEYNDDSDKSFLGDRPEMLPAAERDEYGASGLEETAEATPKPFNFPRAAEKAHDLAPKSQSRPSSPEMSRNQDESRRMSLSRSTESPTAVPLHFRRPPMSPGLPRSVPSETTTPPSSTGSPTQSRHRRPKSVEMSGEMRPLFLVERHGAAKVEPEVDEKLPSLPSSKASSRAPSIENLRELNDEDAVRSWEPLDPSPLMDSRRPTGLKISTEQANEREVDYDVLSSQQVTPTAQNFGEFSESAKKEKRKPEFYSPSDLLRDPAAYPDPSSSNIENLPSPEGSVITVRDHPEHAGADKERELEREVPQDAISQPSEESSSVEKSLPDATGLGFAGLVDAAVIAAAKDDSMCVDCTDNEVSEPVIQPDDHRAADVADNTVTEKSLPETNIEPSIAPGTEIQGFADVVDAAVAAQASSNDKPVDEELGEPGTAIEEQPPTQLELEPPVEIEANRDLVPESSDQPIEPSQPEEEPVVDETKETKSQKKKKKKAKKKQAEESADLPAEPATTTEEQIPALDATEGESRSLEPEPAVVAESEVLSEPQPESVSVEAPRELEVETAALESTEALTPIDEQLPPTAEPDSTSSIPVEAESVEPAIAPESEAQPQPEAAVTDAVTDDQPEEPAGLSKKEARKNKKKNKKNKSVSSTTGEEDAPQDVVEEQSQETVPTSIENQPQQEDRDLATQTGDILETSKIPALEESAEKHTTQDSSVADAPVQSEQESSEFQDSWEMVEPAGAQESIEEQNAQDLSMSTDSFTAIEAPTPELQEAEATEQAKDISLPEATPDVVATPEETAETDSDAFHEAVEEQTTLNEEGKDVETKPSTEAVADIATPAPAEPQETKLEESSETQSKKSKKNKKKNRKSVVFDEAEAPAEPQPSSEPEQLSKDISPEESASVAPAELPESGDAEAPVPLEAAKDVPLLTTEEAVTEVAPLASEQDVATQESELTPSAQVDEEPATLNEPVKEVQETQDQPAAAVEAEPEVPLTAAQKKAAKKAAKKKAKQESVPSIPDEQTPAEGPSTEGQPAEPQVDDSVETQVTPLVSEEPAADVPALISEEDVVSQEPEPTPSDQAVDEEPTTVNEPVKEVEETQDQPAAVVEAEPEVPLTAAQKKAAKKAAKKKAKQESVSSTTDEQIPTEVPSAEPQTNDPVESQVTETAEPVPEAKAAPVDEVMETPGIEVGQTEKKETRELQAEPEAAPADEVKQTPVIEAGPAEIEETRELQVEPESEPVQEPEPEPSMDTVAETPFHEAPQPEVEETKELEAVSDPTLDTAVETPAQPTEAESFKEVSEVPQENAAVEQLSEEPPAGLSKSQKKKWKERQRKLQQQSMSSAPETPAAESAPEPEILAAEPSNETEAASTEAPAPETTSEPATEIPAESSKDVQDSLESETVESSKDAVGEAPANEEAALPTTEEAALPTTDVDAAEPSQDTQAEPVAEARVSLEVPPVADLAQEEEIQAEPVETQQPKEDESIMLPAEETLADSREAETPREEPEAPAVESEQPMSAAEKRKEKKKNKRKSKQLESQSSAETEPSLEQIATEKVEEPTAEAESAVPAEIPSSTVEEAPAVVEPVVTEAVPAETEPEPKADEKPDFEESQDASALDKEVPVEAPTDDAIGRASEIGAEQTADAGAVSEEMPSEVMNAEIAETAAATEATEDSKDVVSAENLPPSEEPTDDKPISNQLAEETSTGEDPSSEAPPEEPAAPVLDSAPAEQAEDTELIASGSKKKNKKKKKKGQSTPTEQESQADSQEPPKEEPAAVEPAAVEPAADEPVAAESAAVEPAADEPATVKDIVPTRDNDVAVLTEEPGSTEESKPQEDQTEVLAVQQPSAEAEPAESEPASKKSKKKKNKRKTVAFEDSNDVTQADTQSEQEPSKEVIPSEDTPEERVLTEEPAQTTSEKEMTEPDTTIEEASKEAVEPVEAVLASEQAPEAGIQEPSTSEASKEVEDASAAVQLDEQPEAMTTTAEVEEEDPELANLSPKEKKKRKKQKEKERKKMAKSLDLTAEEPSTPTETPQEPESEGLQTQDEQTAALKDSKIAEVVDTDAAEQEAADVQPEVEKNEYHLDDQLIEPETTTSVEETISEEATPAHLYEQQLTTIIAEPSAEADAPKEPEGLSEPTTEAEPDTEMTAEERRKAKRAEKKKKRKSKNLSTDEGPAESDPTDATTIAQDAENDTTEPNTSVTAPSPAEDDGKEHQSHDIGTPDVPAQNLTSTDDIVSSQVEQPQLDNLSDYPPQPVLERSNDFGEADDGVEQGSEETAPIALAAEEAPASEEKEVGVEEVVEEKVDETFEKDLENVLKEEERGEENVEAVDLKEEPSMEEKEMAVNQESALEVPEETPAETTKDTAASIVPEPAAVEEPETSKKQKKKNKKNKKKQQEEESIEAEPSAEPEASAAEDKEQPETVSFALEQNQTEEIPELESAPAIEDVPVDQDQRTGDVPEPQPVENVDPLKEIENVEEAEAQTQENTQGEEFEPSTTGIEIPEEHPDAQNTPEAEDAADAKEPAILPSETVEETNDSAPKATEEEQPPAASDEVKSVELFTEVPSQETAVEQSKEAPAPSPGTLEETAAVDPVAEESVDEFKGLSKKQRKKKMAEKAAAAAAAAAAIEAEKAVEPLPLDEVLTADHVPEPTEETPQLEEDVQPATDVQLQPESADMNTSEQPVPSIAEPAEDVADKSIETPLQPDENVAEETVAAELELSKKEKRKAKKKSKQGSADLTADLNEVAAQASEAERPNTTLSAEAPGIDEPKDIVPEPELELPTEEPYEENAREIEQIEPATGPDYEKPAEEAVVQQEDEPQKTDAVALSGPLDLTPPAEADVQHTSVERAQDAAQEVALEREEQIDEEEAEIQAQTSEQEEKPVTEESFRDLPRDLPQQAEGIVLDPKKMSKKELRKAKKKGLLLEDLPVDQEEQVMPESSTTVSKDAEIPPLEPTAEIEEVPSHEAQPTFELAPPIEQDLQLLTEVETSTESAPILSEPTADEPELSLSRKASKASKKAKKAKKGQALDFELPSNVTDDQELALSANKELSFKEEPELEAPMPDETTQDDEWPRIEWEQGKSTNTAPFHDQTTKPEPESVAAIPASEVIEEYDEHAIPVALQEAKELQTVSDEPLSKSAKKKAKKNKRKSEQAILAEPAESAQEPSHAQADLATESTPEPLADVSASREIEVEPPARSLTPGGSSVANLFPGLPRAGFRLKKTAASVKDSAEDETTEDLQANRDIAIPVSEAPPTTEPKEILKTSADALPETTNETSLALEQGASPTKATSTEKPIEEPEFPMSRELFLEETASTPMHSAPREQSPMLFSSSPPTRAEEPSSPPHLLPSQMEVADESSCELRRTTSVIHGRHQHTPRTWNLEEQSIPAMAPSPPRSLFGGPFGEHDSISRPRTPLGTIAEQEPGDGHKGTTAQHGTPRLEIKPEHVLRPVTPERPVPTARSISPVRKFTDNSHGRGRWPTPENEARRSQEDLSRSRSGGESPILKTPEQGMPVLRPSGSKGTLRRTNRSTSSDLRAASRALDAQPPSNLDLDQLPSSSSYDPVTDKGKRPMRNMSDVYEGWGETPSSPRSPSRPPSVRHRRSIQHLQDLESRLDQLISDNRLLAAARDEAEERLRNSSVARRKSDQALYTSGADLRDSKAEIEQLKSSVDWLQKETTRLTQENEGLTASNAALAAAHAAEVSNVRESSTRELDVLRSQHNDLSSQVDERVRQEIESALAQKDAELRRLREDLEVARDKVKELQQQISASVHDNALVFRDEEFFDAACQKLCGHVQQWVLRFSKHSDHRRCRALSELHDEKIADRFDNALLDGSDADTLLSDRVRRRDVFMSVVMTMVWEYIFTRYLFGMDREQRQKLKSLEKQLAEVGPRRAVHRWRATTLTLLSRRPAFAAQRDSDTEAVALEIFGVLSRVLPPPSQMEAQLLESLRKVLRVAVNLSLEMRTQLAEFIMLPPLQPEYDTNGDLARQVYFNASLMNERSGETSSNDELEAQQAVVRIVLFPLVVKKGNDVGEGDDEVVVCPAQVLIARPGKDKKISRMMSGDRMSLDANKSVHSVAPSTFTMDMGSNQF
ncbi:hypothetical protein N7494_002127 [Penicillium frequentans]|uniref:Involucrin repeat protein n=1 Tax=Penicillium frequentans TaxID=3151616 RepID=A0AAD6D3D3_9EURO|nr:hypothetical protein N7494_002127 [Penicillium glabrum]